MKTKLYYLMMCLCLALGAVSFISCGGDDDDDEVGGSVGGKSTLIGSWAEDYEYSYKNGKIVDSRKLSGMIWIFQNENKLIVSSKDGSYPQFGTYTTKDKSFTIDLKWFGETRKEAYQIMKITTDSLILKENYGDIEYDYQIMYFAKTKTKYDDPVNLVAPKGDALQFVGKWKVNDGYWLFDKSGIVYFNSKEKMDDVSEFLAKGSWGYDSATKTLATSLRWEDIWGNKNRNYNYSWTVTVMQGSFWTGICLYGSGNSETFTKVE